MTTTDPEILAACGARNATAHGRASFTPGTASEAAITGGASACIAGTYFPLTKKPRNCYVSVTGHIDAGASLCRNTGMSKTALQEAVEAQLAATVDDPASIAMDGMSKTFRDPRALIELDQYAAKKAGNRFGFGLRKMTPPGH